MFTAQTEWDCPETFPDLSHEKYIAIDLETKDPDLKSKGSGANKYSSSLEYFIEACADIVATKGVKPNFCSNSTSFLSNLLRSSILYRHSNSCAFDIFVGCLP